jgi:hypothetical protein
MSRTNPNQTRPSNPAKIFIEWAGKSDQGYLFFYDKEAKEKKQLKFPFPFVLLDEVSVIKGFNEPLNCGVYSNEIRDTTKEILHVKSHKPGVLFKGLYQEIKNDIKAAGAKYNKSIYIAITGKTGTQIGNLCLKGVGFSAWVDFCKKNNTDIYSQGIVITGAHEVVTKLGKFMAPTFAIEAIDGAKDDAAGELQKVLKAYFTEYFNRPQDEHVAAEVYHEEFQEDIPEDAYLTPKLDEAIKEMEAEGLAGLTQSTEEDDTSEDLPF